MEPTEHARQDKNINFSTRQKRFQGTGRVNTCKTKGANIPVFHAAALRTMNVPNLKLAMLGIMAKFCNLGKAKMLPRGVTRKRMGCLGQRATFDVLRSSPVFFARPEFGAVS